MIQALIYIIAGYFLFGGLAIVIINRRNKAYAARDRWVKYIFYLLVVSATVACIFYGLLSLLALAIAVTGLYEMLAAWLRSARSRKLLWKSLGVYIPVAAAFCLHAFGQDKDDLLFVYTIVFVFDGFAQITGQLLGRKKIFPVISPEKTLAGVIGGYVSVVITSLLLQDITGLPVPHLVMKTLVLATAAMTGDLLASLYKRKCGIKDYSRLIPGHGGILDRFDSYMMAGAVCWLIF